MQVLNKNIQFFPGLKSGGGLGRHCECLLNINHDWSYWDCENKYNNHWLARLCSRFFRRFQDASLQKFDNIDKESAIYLSKLREVPGTVLGFSGCSLRLFEIARKNGTKRIELESPTAHVSHCHEMYKEAHKKYPFDRCWLQRSLRNKMLAEYSIADVIWVNSEYSRQTFLERGIPSSKLQRRFLSVSPRFKGAKDICKSTSLFNIVYVGALTVSKGVPTLIDAFKQINGLEYRLQLVGGSSSSGMSKYLRTQLASDHRISISCGNPIPFLVKADLFVFPSWSDGWGFSAMEAVEYDIPIAVTTHSGCKEKLLAGTKGALFECGNIGDLVKIIERYKKTQIKAQN